MIRTLEEILRESASRHGHLCPRQVLGARMGLYAAQFLELELPRRDKRLLVIAETDGCAVDGLIAAAGCRVGARTLRIVDLGKVAATFTDTCTKASIRLVPSPQARDLANEYACRARNRWEAMLLGYQTMPAAELFMVQPVELNIPLSQIISRPGRKAICEICGEEIINGRERLQNGTILCRGCAGEGYYQLLTPAHLVTDRIAPCGNRQSLTHPDQEPDYGEVMAEAKKPLG